MKLDIPLALFPLIIIVMFIYLPPQPEPSPDYAPIYTTAPKIVKIAVAPLKPQRKPMRIKPQHKPLAPGQLDLLMSKPTLTHAPTLEQVVAFMER